MDDLVWMISHWQTAVPIMVLAILILILVIVVRYGRVLVRWVESRTIDNLLSDHATILQTVKTTITVKGSFSDKTMRTLFSALTVVVRSLHITEVIIIPTVTENRDNLTRELISLSTFTRVGTTDDNLALAPYVFLVSNTSKGRVSSTTGEYPIVNN